MEASMEMLKQNLEATKNSTENSCVSNIAVKPLTSLNPAENIFYVEVIKNGVVLINKIVNKSVITFGRSRECDFPMDHPSISRVHCALLWKEDQMNSESLGFFYLMDLNSTHGTFLNKEKLDSNKLIMVIPGNNVFKLGGSSRVFMLGTKTSVDNEDSSPCSLEENRTNFCSWGILDEEFDENEKEDDSTPLATVLSLLQTDFTSTPTVNHNVYSENPQKALQQWFEREGYEYEYKINCVNGKFKCSFQLSIEGQDVAVEGKLFVKKKESINDACLKCCQLLDKANILFPWQMQKSLINPNKDSDYEDEVIDETGETEKKRNRKEVKTVNTYESLIQEWNNLSSELQSLKVKLAATNLTQINRSSSESTTSEDALDSYMQNLESNKSQLPSIKSKVEKSKLKMKIFELEKSQKRVERLLKISKPYDCLEKMTKCIDKYKTKSDSTTKAEVRDKIHSALQRRKLEKIQSEKEVENPEKKVHKDFTDESLSFKKPLPPLSSEQKTSSDKIITQKHCIEDKKSFEAKRMKNEITKYTAQEAYIDWIPPNSQTGDGRTCLNEKYGY